MHKVAKKTMTLLEIMIVIFIIGIIGSVVGYNMRGSLEEGRVFKTEQAMLKLYEILLLEQAKDKGKEVETAIRANDVEALKTILKKSDLVRNVGDIIQDGWKETFTFSVEGEDIRFYSEKYDHYCAKKERTPNYPWSDEIAEKETGSQNARSSKKRTSR